jgi:hypothetical protein
MRDSCSAAADVLLHQLFIHPDIYSSCSKKQQRKHLLPEDAFVPYMQSRCWRFYPRVNDLYHLL